MAVNSPEHTYLLKEIKRLADIFTAEKEPEEIVVESAISKKEIAIALTLLIKHDIVSCAINKSGETIYSISRDHCLLRLSLSRYTSFLELRALEQMEQSSKANKSPHLYPLILQKIAIYGSLFQHELIRLLDGHKLKIGDEEQIVSAAEVKKAIQELTLS